MHLVSNCNLYGIVFLKLEVNPGTVGMDSSNSLKTDVLDICISVSQNQTS